MDFGFWHIYDLCVMGRERNKSLYLRDSLQSNREDLMFDFVFKLSEGLVTEQIFASQHCSESIQFSVDKLNTVYARRAEQVQIV